MQCLDLSENRFGEQGTTGLLQCLGVNNTLTSLTILTPSSHHLLPTFDIILSKNKELKRYISQPIHPFSNHASIYLCTLNSYLIYLLSNYVSILEDTCPYVNHTSISPFIRPFYIRYQAQIKQLQTENSTLKKEKDWLSWELGNRL